MSAIDNLTDYKRRSIFLSPILVLHVQDDGCIVPTDQGGQILLSDEWGRIKSRIDAAYQKYSDADFEEAMEEAANQKEQIAQSTPAPEHKHRYGWIYVIRSEKGEYKIGKTTRLKERMAWFGVKLPFRVELVTSFECTDIDLFEKNLHKQYASKRLHGEWFALSKSDIEEIKAQ